jgi:hypothetical protein
MIYRVMIEYRIQSSIAHIDAPNKRAAVKEAMRIAPDAARAYVLGRSELESGARIVRDHPELERDIRTSDYYMGDQ